jgi:hypothetical protein
MSEADQDLICPNCKSQEVRRMLSTFAARISGGLGPCGQPASVCGSGRFT